MKELVLVPTIALIVLGFVMQLENIAEDSSRKTLEFASDMNRALDCAFYGIPIKDCSPQLFKKDFPSDINKTYKVLINMSNTLKRN